MAERLSDIRHQDELNRMKGRMRALGVGFEAIASASDEVLSGFHQLLVDVADDMQHCAEEFEAERRQRQKDAGGANV